MANKHTTKTSGTDRKSRKPHEPLMSFQDLFALIRFIEDKGEIGNRRNGIHPRVLADLIRFQFFTACRPGEALIARPCDFKPSGDILLYKPSRESKPGNRRTIYVGGLAKQLVESLGEKRRKKDCLFSHPDQPAVPFTSALYLRSLRHYCRDSEMKLCLPSRLRNIAATFLHMNYGLHVTTEILGIRTPLTPLNFIAVPDFDSTARVAAEWNQKLMESIPS
jgi:integrase